jgi:hypothetical protein
MIFFYSLLFLVLSQKTLANPTTDQAECKGPSAASKPILVAQADDVQEILDYTKDYCLDRSAAYLKILKKIKALPTLARAEIDWDKFFDKLQVLDTSNQMSCVGHSLARSMSLLSQNLGTPFIPSPEFLYDIGAAYSAAIKRGKVDSLMGEMTEGKEIKAQLSKIEKVYKEFQRAKKAKKIQYPATSLIFTLDYATTGPIPDRSAYNQHFQGLNKAKGEARHLKFIDFPPFDYLLQEAVVKCFALNSDGSILKNRKDYSATGTHLADFNFDLIEQSLNKGYYPILSINTDALSLNKDSDEISYDLNGSVGHSFVVVGMGKDDKGVFYETVDSWADEDMKKKNKNFVMKRYKIYQSNLKDKLTSFSLVTSLQVP